jgi:hypothetical protein
MIDEFREYLKVDKHHLDDELVQHSMLFFRVAESYVRAAAKRDELKEELALIDAELDGKMRKRAEDDGEKVTEAMIKGMIITHKDHIQASEAYQAAKTEADMLGALKESFQTRGYLLRDLCQLYTAQYFDANSVKADANTDRAIYEGRRKRIALERGKQA